jgi:hypothetical protein
MVVVEEEGAMQLCRHTALVRKPLRSRLSFAIATLLRLIAASLAIFEEANFGLRTPGGGCCQLSGIEGSSPACPVRQGDGFELSTVR